MPNGSARGEIRGVWPGPEGQGSGQVGGQVCAGGGGHVEFAAEFGAAALVLGAVRDELLPLDRNFFRTGEGLARSLSRLDALWGVARDQLGGGAGKSGSAIARDREAAAMLATGRWVLASAIERRESRGMDHPSGDPLAARRIHVRGVDHVEIVGSDVGRSALGSRLTP